MIGEFKLARTNRNCYKRLASPGEFGSADTVPALSNIAFFP